MARSIAAMRRVAKPSGSAAQLAAHKKPRKSSVRMNANSVRAPSTTIPPSSPNPVLRSLTKHSQFSAACAPDILRTLPVELRKMVFTQCLEMEIIHMPVTAHNNRHLYPVQVTPTLLIALCCEKELYAEALEIFFALNRVAITRNNYQALDQLAPHALQRVKYLHVELDAIVNFESFSGKMAILHDAVHQFVTGTGEKTLFEKIKNVEKLSVQWRNKHENRTLDFIKVMMEVSGKLKVINTQETWAVQLSFYNALGEKFCRKIDKFIDVKGKRFAPDNQGERHLAPNVGENRMECFVWEAGQGQHLVLMEEESEDLVGK